VTTRELLERIRTSRESWDALIERAGYGRMDDVVEDDGRTLRDVVAHITWFEREILELISTRALVGSDLWMLPTPERNAAIRDMNSDRSAQDVLEEARRVHASLMDALATLGDGELIDPACFENMPAEWVPWRIIAENTYAHYEDHAVDVRQRLKL
jgi:hypothetical protein